MKTIAPELVRQYSSAAVQAWSKLGMSSTPDNIVLLRHKGHSIVFRFRAKDTTVIAKRTKANMVRLEQTIYEQILGYLPFPTLHCYGSSDGEDPQHRWLFLEDAGDERFSATDPIHAGLAVQWLARMHRYAADPGWASLLPDAGPSRYFEHLSKARACLQEVQESARLDRCDLELLKETTALLDVLKLHWEKVERCCAFLPKTLVHGDFVKKNLRIRHDGSGLVLLPLDWETAGWGYPAADLIGVQNLRHYWLSSRFEITLPDLERVGHCGRIFRMVASIDWDARRLRFEWVENAMANMRMYSSQLEDSMRALGWTLRSAGGSA